MSTWTLKQLINGGFQPLSFAHFEPGEQTAIPFISQDDLRNTLRRFGDRVYAPLYNEGDTLEQAIDDINMTWELFHNLHDDMAWRLYSAFAAEYKPLENYSMIESGTDSRTTNRNVTEEKTSVENNNTIRTGNITNTISNETTTSDLSTRTDNLESQLKRAGTVAVSASDTGKTTDNTKTTTTNTGTQSTETSGSSINSVSAYDSTDFSNRDKQTNTGADTRTDNLTSISTNSGDIDTTASSTATTTNDTTDTTSNTGTQENRTDTTVNVSATNSQEINTNDENSVTGSMSGETTDSGLDNLEHTLTRSGNIGVTTSQQMLTSEVYLRARNNLVYYIVELFVSQYTTW